MPNLSEGDEITVDFKPTEKETQPPKHYTIETLNSYLKNPFRDDKKTKKPTADEDTDGDDADDADDEADYKAMLSGLELGTEATRTGIIDNARKSGYIALTKDVYTILPMGEYMIESLSRMGITMDKYKTAEVGVSLKKVFRGECAVMDSVAVAEREIKSVFDKETDFTPSPPPGAEANGGEEPTGEVIGKCPLCGGDVRQGKFNYACEKYKRGCEFSVGTKICSKAITPSMMKKMLFTGSSGLLKGFTSKAGKKFDAELKLVSGKLTFVFENKPENAPQKDRAIEVSPDEAPPPEPPPGY